MFQSLLLSLAQHKRTSSSSFFTFPPRSQQTTNICFYSELEDAERSRAAAGTCLFIHSKKKIIHRLFCLKMEGGGVKGDSGFLVILFLAFFLTVNWDSAHM